MTHKEYGTETDGHQGPKATALAKGKKAPAWAKEVKLLSAVPERRLQWFWYPYITGGSITLLAGNPGVGKGLTSASLAASITSGGKFPDGTQARKGCVFWAETEDPTPEVLRPRLLAAGADPDLLGTLDLVGKPEVPDLTELADQIRAWITHKETPLRLIVLSPIKSFLPNLKNTNDETLVRYEMAKLIDLVKGTDCAILGLFHLNKKEDLSVLNRLAGSNAFAQMVRGVLSVDMDEGDVRRFVNVKHSYGPEGKQLLFVPRHVGKDPQDQSVRVDWSVADDWRDPNTIHKPQIADEGQAASAREWLERYLDEHGPTLKETVVSAGQAAGYKLKTLEAAYSRGRRDQLFWGEVEGFRGPARWMLAEHSLPGYAAKLRHGPAGEGNVVTS